MRREFPFPRVTGEGVIVLGGNFPESIFPGDCLTGTYPLRYLGVYVRRVIIWGVLFLGGIRPRWVLSCGSCPDGI